jgi:hypothetical protein
MRTLRMAIQTDNMNFPTWEVIVFAWFFTGLLLLLLEGALKSTSKGDFFFL